MTLAIAKCKMESDLSKTTSSIYPFVLRFISYISPNLTSNTDVTTWQPIPLGKPFVRRFVEDVESNEMNFRCVSTHIRITLGPDVN